MLDYIKSLFFMLLLGTSSQSFAGNYSIGSILCKYLNGRCTKDDVLRVFSSTAKKVRNDKKLDSRNRKFMVLNMFHKMQNQGIEPNVISYSAAISACEKAGDRDTALNLFQRAVDCGVYLSLNYGTIINLHIDQIYTKNSIDFLVSAGIVSKNHMTGIPSALAIMILGNSPGLVGRKIITGWLGDGLLTDSVKSYLDAKYLKYSLDGFGSFTIISQGLRPQAKLFTASTVKPQDLSMGI